MTSSLGDLILRYTTGGQTTTRIRDLETVAALHVECARDLTCQSWLEYGMGPETFQSYRDLNPASAPGAHYLHTLVTSTPAEYTPHAAPEPRLSWLLGIGLTALACRRAR
jgi:hypothetical protein